MAMRTMMLGVALVLSLILLGERSEGTPNEAAIPLDDVAAVWVKQHDDSWISYIGGAPEFVNERFFERYAPHLVVGPDATPPAATEPRFTRCITEYRCDALNLRHNNSYPITQNEGNTYVPTNVSVYCSDPGTDTPRPLSIRVDDGSDARCLNEGGLLFIPLNEPKGPRTGQMNVWLSLIPREGYRSPSTSERIECPNSGPYGSWTNEQAKGGVDWYLNGEPLRLTGHNSHRYSFSSQTIDLRAPANVELLKDGLNTIRAVSCQVKYREYRGYRDFVSIETIEDEVTFRIDFALLGWDE